MKTYSLEISSDGKVTLPPELIEELGLVYGKHELRFEFVEEGKYFIVTAIKAPMQPTFLQEELQDVVGNKTDDDLTQKDMALIIKILRAYLAAHDALE